MAEKKKRRFSERGRPEPKPVVDRSMWVGAKDAETGYQPFVETRHHDDGTISLSMGSVYTWTRPAEG